MKRLTALGVILTPFILGTQAVLAEGYPWQDHAAPFDFLLEPSAHPRGGDHLWRRQ